MFADQSGKHYAIAALRWPSRLGLATRSVLFMPWSWHDVVYGNHDRVFL